MANGFAPYLLKHIAEIAKENTPQYKLEPAGYLNLLKSQQSADIVKLNTDSGHLKTVQVKKKQRYTVADVETSKSCSVTTKQAFTEDTVSLASTRALAIYLEDETVAKYEEDASRTVALGGAATGVMNDLLDSVMTASSAILQGVNIDLMTLQAAAFGKHRATGTNAAVSVNFPQNTNVNPLNSGMTKLLADYKKNGGMGRPQVFGSGLIFDYILQQYAKSADQSGMDTKIMAAGVDFYHDMNAETILGANQFGVIQPNAVQLVEYLEYTGFKAGQKPGASWFGTMALPMLSGADILPIDFDIQLRYSDCPASYTIGGSTVTLEKGYNLIISKQCGLWTIPSNAYKSTDPLTGNRGSLRYVMSNNCDICS